MEALGKPCIALASFSTAISLQPLAYSHMLTYRPLRSPRRSKVRLQGVSHRPTSRGRQSRSTHSRSTDNKLASIYATKNSSNALETTMCKRKYPHLHILYQVAPRARTCGRTIESMIFFACRRCRNLPCSIAVKLCTPFQPARCQKKLLYCVIRWLTTE